MSEGSRGDYGWIRGVLVAGLGPHLGEMVVDELQVEIGPLPASSVAALGLIRGPIRRALSDRLGDEQAGQLATQLEQALVDREMMAFDSADEEPLPPEPAPAPAPRAPPGATPAAGAVRPALPGFDASAEKPPAWLGSRVDVLEELSPDDYQDEEMTGKAEISESGNGGIELGVDLEIDVDFDEEVGGNRADTVHFRVVGAAVPVLIVAESEALSVSLVERLGPERVRTVTVNDENELRHHVFSMSPVIVVVNGLESGGMPPAVLARAIRGLPDSMLAVLFGADAGFGREVSAYLHGAERIVTLARGEGVEPLVDLVSSRHTRPEL